MNALSAGRRRKSVSKGKAKLPPGRPKGMKVATYPPSRYIMPTRKQAPGKRMHSLKNSIHPLAHRVHRMQESEISCFFC